MPKRIAAGSLHLHDFGTEVGEDHRREPAGWTLGQVEDAKTFEGLHPHGVIHARWLSIVRARWSDCADNMSCGKPGSIALTASSRAFCSADNVRSTHPRLSFSCSSVRAPMSGTMSAGPCRTQAIAT